MRGIAGDDSAQGCHGSDEDGPMIGDLPFKRWPWPNGGRFPVYFLWVPEVPIVIWLDMILRYFASWNWFHNISKFSKLRCLFGQDVTKAGEDAFFVWLYGVFHNVSILVGRTLGFRPGLISLGRWAGTGGN